MTEKPKRKKRKLKISVYAAIAMLFVLAVSVRAIIRLHSDITMSTIRFHTVDIGQIKKSITKDMVVIRDNIPIISESSGVLTKFYSQGQRVAKGSVICKIQDSQNAENEIAELNRLNAQIDTLQNGAINYSPEVQLKQLQERIAELYLQLQDRIKTKDFNYVASIKSELVLLIAQANAISGNEQASVQDLQSLINKRNKLQSRLSSGKSYIRAGISGCLSYYRDGYEDLFAFSNIKNLTVKDIREAAPGLEKLDGSKTKQGDVVGYVVNNHYYYMATDIEAIDVDAVKRDTRLDIIVQDKTVNAYFYDFYKDKNGEFIGFFKVESEDYDYLKNRKDKAKIVYQTANGLIIPNCAIVEKDGEKGVYKVDKTGTAVYVELDGIIASDEENTAINYSFDSLGDKSKIGLYDDIILTPKNVEDGQKVR